MTYNRKTYIQKYAQIDATMYRVEYCPMPKPNACKFCCGAESQCIKHRQETQLSLCFELNLRHDEVLVPQHYTPTPDDLRRQSERLQKLLKDRDDG